MRLDPPSFPSPPRPYPRIRAKFEDKLGDFRSTLSLRVVLSALENQLDNVNNNVHLRYENQTFIHAADMLASFALNRIEKECR